MKTRTLMAGVASLSLLVVPASFAQQGTPGAQPMEGVTATAGDQELEKRIQEALSVDTSLSAHAENIQIKAVDGKVTLQGSVPSEKEKEEIANKVQQMEGVKEVDNQLQAKQESEKAESSSQQAIPLASSKPAQQDTLISSNTIVGAIVKNPQGEELGEIAELMLDPQTGTIKHAVLALSGGWLTEAKRVALPWETMKVGLGQGELVVEIDKEQLQNAPRAQTTP